ncbi:MAG: 16S rRNA (guanine(966)-N(2))-methyltransferase RsmD [Frankiaceae bacterium]
MTRIVAGIAGGRPLRVPPGAGTRPTGDRAREGLFSTLASLVGDLAGLRFLDLYAGSGAVGLEALSRGAGHVLLVESAPRVARVLRENVAALRLPGAVVRVEPVAKVVAAPAVAPYDVVFADPPYALAAEELAEVLCRMVAGAWVAPMSVVAVERSSRDEAWQWPAPIEPLRSRRYGDTTLWYGRAASAT